MNDIRKEKGVEKEETTTMMIEAEGREIFSLNKKKTH